MGRQGRTMSCVGRGKNSPPASPHVGNDMTSHRTDLNHDAAFPHAANISIMTHQPRMEKAAEATREATPSAKSTASKLMRYVLMSTKSTTAAKRSAGARQTAFGHRVH